MRLHSRYKTFRARQMSAVVVATPSAHDVDDRPKVLLKLEHVSINSYVPRFKNLLYGQIRPLFC